MSTARLELRDGAARTAKMVRGKPLFTCADLCAEFGRGEEKRFDLVVRVEDDAPALWISVGTAGAVYLFEANVEHGTGRVVALCANVGGELACDTALAWLAPLQLAARACYVVDDLATAPKGREGTIDARALALARSFPSLREVPCIERPRRLKDGSEAFDADRLIEWLGTGPTSGSRAAALLVLEVWNGCTGLPAHCPDCGWCPKLAESDVHDMNNVALSSVERIARLAVGESADRLRANVAALRCYLERASAVLCGPHSEPNEDGRPCLGATKLPVAPRFSLQRAVDVWDEAHRAAFRAWAREPFTL